MLGQYMQFPGENTSPDFLTVDLGTESRVTRTVAATTMATPPQRRSVARLRRIEGGRRMIQETRLRIGSCLLKSTFRGILHVKDRAARDIVMGTGRDDVVYRARVRRQLHAPYAHPSVIQGIEDLVARRQAARVLKPAGEAGVLDVD